MLHSSVLLQSAATTGNGNAVNLHIAGAGDHHTLYVNGAGTITAGKIQWETARSASESGAWAPLAAELVVAAGEQKQTFTGPLYAVRARISEDVAGGGSVTVRMISHA